MTGQIVFDGRLIRATLFNPGQDRMFVSFRQRLATPGAFNTARPVRSFTKQGYSHLHLQSRWNDWYINEDTSALENALAALTADYSTVVAMGFSMGGYAALRFAGPLRLRRLIVTSPQYSIAPDHVPFDRRFRDCAATFDPLVGDLAPRGSDVQGVILADSFRPMDIRNAALIKAAFPHMKLARLCGGGHPATQVLREGGKFGWLQRQLLQERVNPGAIVNRHRKSRRQSALYWSVLSEAARKSGRPALEASAARRANALSRAG